MFGVPSGKLLGFFVSHRGIEANPDKIKAFEQIQVPKTVKDVRRLTGCVAALRRFISMSAERAMRLEATSLFPQRGRDDAAQGY